MRFDRIAFRGIGPFTGAVEIDLAGLRGPVVAVSGTNGSGKTTFLECLPGSLTRTCPTRGPLNKLATARDAYLEVTTDKHVIRHTLDGVRGTGEALVTDLDGAPAYTSTKVSDFDAWAAANLPTDEVLRSSSIGIQGEGGFLDLKPGDRKAVLLRALGIERLELIAERSRLLQRESASRIETLQATRAEVAPKAVLLGESGAAVEHCRTVASSADDDVAETRAALESAQLEHAALVEAHRDRENAIARRNRASVRLQEVERERDRLADRVSAQEALAADADAIRDAATAVSSAEADVRKHAEAHRTLTAEADRLRQDEARARDDARAAADREVAAAGRMTGPAALLVQESSIRAEAAERGAREAALDEHDAAIAQAEAEVEALRGQSVAGLGERIGCLRSTLVVIADSETDDPARTASGGLAEDDDAVKNAVETPKALREARLKLTEVRDARGPLASALLAAKLAESKLPALATAQEQADAAGEDRDAAQAEKAEASERARDLARQRGEVESAAANAQRAKSAAESEVQRHSPLAARLTDVEQVAARLEELRPQLTAATEAVVQAQAELDACPEPPADAPIPDLDRFRRSIDIAEREAKKAHADVARAEQRLEAVEKAAERLAAIDADIVAEQLVHDDHARLGRDLGRDGLQAIEIDSAGPEISEIATTLLHEAFGTRWTVSLETTRLSADGKKQIETFEVRVVDSERGRDGEVKTLSGGERVIVGEAVSLALTAIACRRTGIERPTLIRDESGAQLDAERQRQYVAMLRRAVDLIGADKVLLVSHWPEVWSLADSRIYVQEGLVVSA